MRVLTQGVHPGADGGIDNHIDEPDRLILFPRRWHDMDERRCTILPDLFHPSNMSWTVVSSYLIGPLCSGVQ